MLQKMYFIRVKQNNTLVSVDIKGFRGAVDNLVTAHYFGTEEAAKDFVEVVSDREGEFFRKDVEVIQGFDFEPTPYGETPWPIVNVDSLNQVALGLGITDVHAFRGKVGHWKALVDLGLFEQLAEELEELKNNGRESIYPPAGYTEGHSFLEHSEEAFVEDAA